MIETRSAKRRDRHRSLGARQKAEYRERLDRGEFHLTFWFPSRAALEDWCVRHGTLSPMAEPDDAMLKTATRMALTLIVFRDIDNAPDVPT